MVVDVSFDMPDYRPLALERDHSAAAFVASLPAVRGAAPAALAVSAIPRTREMFAQESDVAAIGAKETSKASPAKGTVPTIPSRATLAAIRATESRHAEPMRFIE